MDRKRCVYIISHPMGFCKIGFSIDPVARCLHLSTAHPVPLKLEHTWQCDCASTVERKAHIYLSEHRVGGEWFKVSVDAAAFAVAISIDTTIIKKERLVKNRKDTTDRYNKTLNINTLKRKSYSSVWTEERYSILRKWWETGESSRNILEEINSVAGPRVCMSRISTKARELGLKRPCGYVASHASSSWTPERHACLLTQYPAGITIENIISTIQSMDGDRITAAEIQSKIARFKLRRPKNFNSQDTKHLQNPRWTPEREACLRSRYPAGALPRDLLFELLALPGTKDITWDIVRERAKHLKIKRPANFIKDNVKAIKLQAAEVSAQAASTFKATTECRHQQHASTPAKLKSLSSKSSNVRTLHFDIIESAKRDLVAMCGGSKPV